MTVYDNPCRELKSYTTDISMLIPIPIPIPMLIPTLSQVGGGHER